MAQSSSEFNEPDFIEYDPTPYDGGYDIAAAYGNPLPPSDAICYPHSVSKPNSSPPPNGSSNGPVTHPNGKGVVEQATSPESSPEQAGPCKDDEEEKPWSNYNGNWLRDPNFDRWGGDGYGVCGSGYGYDYGKPDSNYQGHGYSGIDDPQSVYDYYPWSGCAYGDGERGNGYGGQKAQSQFGYSRDDLGPCAALFDYWPCLYRKDQKSYRQLDDVENCYGNQWKGAADYLFGSLNPHGERRDEGVSYGYYRHYPEQPISVQYDYNEQSWSQNISQCEVYHEEPYLQPNYGEDWYGGNDEYVHYQQLKYSYSDE